MVLQDCTFKLKKLETNRIHIKNMVCPRCISAVEMILKEQDILYSQVKLGEVSLNNSITSIQKEKLSEALSLQGFELLESEKSSLIAQIKAAIISKIHHSSSPMKENFSTFLANRLNQEYSSISRLFSSVEGITIEKYITAQKIEKAKELLYYDEMSLAEIAFQLEYSSSAYLSSQFKKETGMTPSEFKKQSDPKRRNLDSL
jgi:AraC-like DNA-binding protein